MSTVASMIRLTPAAHTGLVAIRDSLDKKGGGRATLSDAILYLLASHQVQQLKTEMTKRGLDV